MRKLPTLFVRTLSTLSFEKIVMLIRATAPHPLFTLLSFYATARSFSIAQKHFPKTSAANGIGNAYRHALWTCLILMYCCKVSSPQKALNYCKKITDLHEELFPNKPLEKKMDLHNNKVGMDLFMKLLQGIHRQFFETSFFVEHLMTKTKTAVILSDINQNPGEELVYLEE
ncbi:DUF6973 domain-containing protein [Chryseobacterium sp.]|uniref:DUF6973 domain-containing protein n=1 Tax=Chryseobacterium sp. TaxID=1871047 RepID=UPI0012A88E6C|nr:hypothetical protein [Chryseobacterium sp.]QFG54267.1 hypothetical protein F7R58_12190 [Chryseobacterium sp.]